MTSIPRKKRLRKTSKRVAKNLAIGISKKEITVEKVTLTKTNRQTGRKFTIDYIGWTIKAKLK